MIIIQISALLNSLQKQNKKQAEILKKKSESYHKDIMTFPVIK